MVLVRANPACISVLCQLLAFPKFGMLVRMVVVCFTALRYFLLVLCILIARFAVTFMLLTGASRGESWHYTGPGGSTACDTRFDITDLQVALADTLASDTPRSFRSRRALETRTVDPPG